MALVLSQTRQLPREVTHSIFHRAFLTTYGKYRSIPSVTLVIFKVRATEKLHRRQEAGHLPVALVIARQAIRVMGPAMRRTPMPESTEGRKRDPIYT